MKNFNDYLNEKLEDNISINENIDKTEKTFQQYVEYNWYVDKKLSMLESLGGNNESV